MTTLNEIYETLVDLGYCRDQQDFSRRWLGRSEGYFAYIKSSGAAASPTSLGMLAAQLHAITPTSDDSSRHVERRRLRSAWVAVMTMWMGERENVYAKPWERVVTIDPWSL